MKFWNTVETKPGTREFGEGLLEFMKGGKGCLQGLDLGLGEGGEMCCIDKVEKTSGGIDEIGAAPRESTKERLLDRTILATGGLLDARWTRFEMAQAEVMGHVREALVDESPSNGEVSPFEEVIFKEPFVELM